MKKKRSTNRADERKVETMPGSGASLGERLNRDLAEQLKQLKKDKEEELQRKKEEEQARKQFEARQREKNKTFAELLAESNLDWKKFK